VSSEAHTCRLDDSIIPPRNDSHHRFTPPNSASSRHFQKQDGWLLVALYFIVLQLLIITSLTLFFSSFSSPLLSAVFAFSLFVIGNFAEDLRGFAAMTNGVSRWLATGAAYLVPNFSALNLISSVAHGKPVAGQLIFYNTEIFATYGLHPPTTWDEYDAAARKITEGSGGTTYGAVVQGQADPLVLGCAFINRLVGYGGNLVDRSERPYSPDHLSEVSFDEAHALLGEAGFPVTKKDDGFECSSFPVTEVEFIFNTNSSNKSMAEFMQAQWKQNLGITVPLRSMESKTFMNARSKLDYKGFAVFLWGADYMDPFTFLGLFSTPGGVNGTGWYDLKYVAMLDEANRTADHQKRYELLAKAEKYALDVQPVIPIETFSVNWLKKPYVKGMYPNAAGLYAWKFVYIERDSAKWDYSTPSTAD